LNVTDDPSLVISIYNEKKQLIESTRDVRNPSIISVEIENHAQHQKKQNIRGSITGKHGGFIYWGQSWHLQTPLENLEPNSFLVIEYRPRGELLNQTNSFVVSPLSAQFEIDLSAIDSSLEAIELNPAMEVGNKQANPILAQNEKSILSMEIILTRKNRPIDLKTILSEN
jgi:hypothetical protein